MRSPTRPGTLVAMGEGSRWPLGGAGHTLPVPVGTKHRSFLGGLGVRGPPSLEDWGSSAWPLPLPASTCPIPAQFSPTPCWERPWSIPCCFPALVAPAGTWREGLQKKDRGLSSGVVEGLWEDCFQPPLGTSWILLLLVPGAGTVDAADIAQIQEADPYPAHIQKAASPSSSCSILILPLSLWGLAGVGCRKATPVPREV